MRDITLAEIEKLKRYAILRAGFIVVLLSSLYGFAPVLANDGVRKDFALLMNNILESNCIYFFPAMIILIGGFIARREYTDDTIKNILIVPVSIRKLLVGKIIVLFLLTILFSILSVLFGVVLSVIANLPGMTVLSVAEWAGRIVCTNASLFVAVLPLVIVSCLFVDAVYACTAIGFVYGFFASMESAMLNYHPVKAAMILFDPQTGAGYDFLNYSKTGAFVTLLVVFFVSLGLFMLLKPPQILRKTKAKKVTRAKGW